MTFGQDVWLAVIAAALGLIGGLSAERSAVTLWRSGPSLGSTRLRQQRSWPIGRSNRWAQRPATFTTSEMKKALTSGWSGAPALRDASRSRRLIGSTRATADESAPDR